MTNLADGVVYSRSGLTYQARSLDERGLVTRGPSPADERSTIVAITDQGRNVLAKVFSGHIEAVKTHLFESLDAGDVEMVARVMTQVSRHLWAKPPRSARPRKGTI